jgi:hypothetical protein
VSGGSDDLLSRAKADAGGFTVPDHWGEVVELEPGESFVGRFRGREKDSRGNPVYLAWNADDARVFFWPAYRLDQGMQRERPAVGATICVVRDSNYATKFDSPDEPTGKAIGVASEPNDAPLPESPAKSEYPF